MKWIKLLIDVALAILPGLALKGKKNLEQELEIANKTIEIITSDMPLAKKGRCIEDAVNNLKAVKGFRKRFNKKIDKAKLRLYKKFF